MKYQVPQFIEVEDKIFGPLTLKQFIYLAGGGGAVIVLYLILPLFLAIIPMALVLGLSLALAFYKVNNKPFINVLEAAVKFIFGPRLYIWQKVEKPVEAPEVAPSVDPSDYSALLGTPQIKSNKLKELSASLDIKGQDVASDEEKILRDMKGTAEIPKNPERLEKPEPPRENVAQQKAPENVLQ